jgi:hypothetical protein
MENGKQTDILVMDFSKAFDKVSHSLLLHKLHYYGIQGENSIFQFVSQFDSLSGPCCSVSASLFDFIARYAMVSSANRRTVFMKEQAYKSLVRPPLEYVCSVWDPYLQQDI